MLFLYCGGGGFKDVTVMPGVPHGVTRKTWGLHTKEVGLYTKKNFRVGLYTRHYTKNFFEKI